MVPWSSSTPADASTAAPASEHFETPRDAADAPQAPPDRRLRARWARRLFWAVLGLAAVTILVATVGLVVAAALGVGQGRASGVATSASADPALAESQLAAAAAERNAALVALRDMVVATARARDEADSFSRAALDDLLAQARFTVSELEQSFPQAADASGAGADLPTAVAWRLLGEIHQGLDDPAAADTWLARAEAALRPLSNAPDAPEAAFELALVLVARAEYRAARGDPADEVETAFGEAQTHLEALVERNDRSAEQLATLAGLYDAQGDWSFDRGLLDDAEQLYQLSLRAAERLVQRTGGDDPDGFRLQSHAWTKLASVHDDRDDDDEARAAYAKAAEFGEQFVRAVPDDLAAREELAIVYQSLGELEHDANRRADARQHFAAALAHYDALGPVLDEQPSTVVEMGYAALDYGDLLWADEDEAAAERQYARVVRSADAIEDGADDDPTSLVVVAGAYRRLGDLYVERPDLAERHYRESLRALDAWPAAALPHAWLDWERTAGHARLARLLTSRGRSDEATPHLEAALELLARYDDVDADAALWAWELAALHLDLAEVLLSRGHAAEADTLAARAVDWLEGFVPEDDPAPGDLRQLYRAYLALAETTHATDQVKQARRWLAACEEVLNELSDLPEPAEPARRRAWLTARRQELAERLRAWHRST